MASRLIQNAQESKKNGDKQRPDFVSLMTREMIPESDKETASKGFTRQEIIAQTMVFIMAGSSTTGDLVKFLL